MKYDEYCISAGEFAKLCQTTRDTLRYYDKMGILTPMKNEENGYRYYSHKQITTFYFINFYRALDCPVKYLKHFMQSAISEEFSDLVNTQYMSLLEMKKEIDKKLELISAVVDFNKRVLANPDGEVILETESKPFRIFATDIKSSPAYCAKDVITDVTNHINLCVETEKSSSFPLGCIIDKDKFFANDFEYSKMFSIASPGKKGNDIYTLPTSTYVSCICSDTHDEIVDVYRKIQQFIKDNNLTVKSNVYSLSLMNLVDSNETKRYIKYIFVCV